MLIVFLFLFPLFFLLSGSVFHSDELVYITNGNIFLTPIPIACIFSLLGIIYLLKAGKNYIAIGIFYSFFVLMLLSIVITNTSNDQLKINKFVLLIQFIYPFLGLIFGFLYIRPRSIFFGFETLCLFIITLIIPLQIFSSFLHGFNFLSPNIFLFSIYQHLDQIPLIFISMYFIALGALYKIKILKSVILIFAPIIGAYLAFSLTYFSFILFLYLSALSILIFYKNNFFKYLLTCLTLILFSFSFCYSFIYNGAKPISIENEIVKQDVQRDKINNENFKKFLIVNNITIEKEFNIIFFQWKKHLRGIFENPKSLLFGHSARLDRNKHPSAYNYYLDLIFNFGLLSFLPILYLICITLASIISLKQNNKITPNLALLIGVLIFYILFLCSFQVPLRQPYTGMVIFFFWGVVLSDLSKIKEGAINHK